MKKIVSLPIARRILFTVTVPEPGESLFWEIDDGDFTYASIFQVAFVRKNDDRMRAVQIVAGIVLVSFAWLLRPKKCP